jgi:hypothetical protein
VFKVGDYYNGDLVQIVRENGSAFPSRIGGCTMHNGEVITYWIGEGTKTSTVKPSEIMGVIESNGSEIKVEDMVEMDDIEL